MKEETDQLIAELICGAKDAYESNMFFKALEDPMMIKNYETALWACQVATVFLRKGQGKVDWIIERLLLRLAEYIERDK
jgi:hypothetical protein